MPSRSHMVAVLAAGVLAGAPAVAFASPLEVVPGSGATARQAPASAAQPPQILWTVNGAPAGAPKAPTSAPNPSHPNNLLFHGGVVQHHPRVYLIFWGQEWQQGFRTGPANRYTQATAMNYVISFFGHVGGSAWNGVQTQYCDNIAPGSDTCAGSPLARYIANSPRVLAGSWVDPTPAPATIVTAGLAENLVDDPIASEAVRAASHFGYDPDATYMIWTPPGHAATAYGSVYCAYHSETTNPGGHGIRYAFMPFTPEQGAGCGGNSVNKTNDAFGHGYFDSYSLAGGHEYAEAVTDPDAWPFQDGWNDYQTSENGDKCAYFHETNLHLGSLYFAVQPMWSNEANNGSGGCAIARGTGPAPVPSTTPV